MSAIAERAIEKLKTFSENDQQEVMDFIDFLAHKNAQASSNKTQQLQEIMRNLASQNAFSQIENPAEWQRELRQQKKMSLGDSIIGAKALLENKTLITRNTSDFEWINGLNLINPIDK